MFQAQITFRQKKVKRCTIHKRYEICHTNFTIFNLTYLDNNFSINDFESTKLLNYTLNDNFLQLSLKWFQVTMKYQKKDEDMHRI